MHAMFIEVDNPHADEAGLAAARTALNQNAVPMSREMGATGGYWLAPQGGRGVAVVLFDTEDAAQQAAGRMQVGQAPPGAPPGVIFRTVEVREVLAKL